MLLMGVGMVVVCGLGWLVRVVLLMVVMVVLLSLFCFLFATGPLLVLDRSHSSLHRAIFETFMQSCPYPWISVSAAGPLRVS